MSMSLSHALVILTSLGYPLVKKSSNLIHSCFQKAGSGNKKIQVVMCHQNLPSLNPNRRLVGATTRMTGSPPKPTAGANPRVQKIRPNRRAVKPTL